MKESSIKIQIQSLEHQLKVLKSKIVPSKNKKNISGLYGIFKGKMDFSLEEIKKHQYSFKDIS